MVTCYIGVGFMYCPRFYLGKAMLHFKTPIILLLTLLLAVPIAAQDETTFRFGHPFRSGDFDPAREGDGGEYLFFDLIFDTLVAIDTEGDVQPRLATDWELTDETLVFTLREDAVFSDGTPFDAEAAVASLERAREVGSPSTQTTLRGITAFEATDPYTLTVTHDNSNRFLLQSFAEYGTMMVSPNAFETVGEAPVGTGPYVLNLDETITNSIYVYERHEGFWDNENIAVDRVEITNTPIPNLLNGFLGGTLDGVLLTDGFTRTIPTEDYTVLTTEVAFYALAFWDRAGTVVPEFADPAVRCALGQAIDVALYNEAVTGVALNPLTTIPPENWYGASGVSTPSYDPDAALAALEAAGAADMTVPLTTFPAIQTNHEAIVGFLSDLGLDVESIVKLDNEVYGSILGGNEPAGYINMNATHFSTFVDTYVLADGLWNPYGVVDEDIAALAEEARTLSLEEAEPLYQEISRLLNERCYFIPLSVGSTAVLLTDEVVGAEGRFRTNGFLNVRNISLDR